MTRNRLNRWQSAALAASIATASLFAAVGPSRAGSIPIATGAFTAFTAGTTDSVAVAAGAVSVYLEVWNLSPTATVCLSFGAAATISGTTCAAGEVPLPPSYHWQPDGVLPTDVIHAIASAAGIPMTVGAK